MLPASFPQQNFVYQKPEGWTDEQCMDLPVWKGQGEIDEQGATTPTIISCWKLSKEDLEEIQRTGVVWLSISGTGMPPVSVFTENPFNNG
jgi:hypothetical protein